ncbi:hypothetical protein [Streptomyces sp. NPDC048639]|uniref:hypothetical protein n=1 Tax=Streptomyces sp. NPDC048639 TaxID=3365581 RepID=UPI00371A691E
MRFNTLLRDHSLFLRGQTAPTPQLRRRTRRLLLVALALVAVTLVLTTALADGFPGLPVACGWIVLPVALRWFARRGTRALSLAPSELLDELQLQQVHSAYRRAYGVTTAAQALVLFGAFPLVAFTDQPHPLRMVFMAAYLILLMMVWMPTAVLAWSLEDEEPDDVAAAPA